MDDKPREQSLHNSLLDDSDPVPLSQQQADVVSMDTLRDTHYRIHEINAMNDQVINLLTDDSDNDHFDA